MRFTAVSSVLSILCALFAGCASPDRTPEQWIASTRLPLRFDAQAPAIPAALVDACRGARVVGLGEFSHGTHEDALLKSALALALIDAGEIDTLYIEANRTGGEQLDAFIRAGQGDAREAVERAEIFRVLKTEGFAHLIAGMQQRVAAGKNLRIVGIDCQHSRPDAEFALGRLAARDAAAAERIRATLAPIVGPAAASLRHPNLIKSIDTAGWKRCVAGLGELERALAADPVGAAVALRARQGLLSFEHEVSDGDPSKIEIAYFSLRDRFMADNILADGARHGAFWGHNVHIFGGPRELTEGYVPSGTVLREALGPAYRVVVCDYRFARIRAVVAKSETEMPDALDPQEVVERKAIAGDFADAIASDAQGSVWIDLSAMPAGGAFDAWRATPRAVDWPGYAMFRERRDEYLMRIPVAKLVDVVVVLDEVGPARPLSGVDAAPR